MGHAILADPDGPSAVSALTGRANSDKAPVVAVAQIRVADPRIRATAGTTG
jgi:hypothetical protein